MYAVAVQRHQRCYCCLAPAALLQSDEAGAAASATSIDLSLSRREMVILGTRYAGEMKKGVFM